MKLFIGLVAGRITIVRCRSRKEIPKIVEEYQVSVTGVPAHVEAYRFTELSTKGDASVIFSSPSALTGRLVPA